MASGYVLDATEKQVRIQKRGISHSLSQLWMLQRGENQLVLRNVGNGNVLDVDANRNVVTAGQRGSQLSQQWFPQPDNFIRNKHSNSNYVLDIHEGNLTPGNKLIVFPQNRPKSSNQLFSFIQAF